MAVDNLLFLVITAGSSVEIQAGFNFLSIRPRSGATYTITNSLAGDLPSNQGNRVSGSYSVDFTFPDPPSPDGWASHIITASGGSVDVTFSNGR